MLDANRGIIDVLHLVGARDRFIAGQVEVTVGSQVRVLGPGEAYYFESRVPHRFRNVGEDEAVIVSANTPATF